MLGLGLGLEAEAAHRDVGRDQRGRLALAEGVQRLWRRYAGDVVRVRARARMRGRGG